MTLFVNCSRLQASYSIEVQFCPSKQAIIVKVVIGIVSWEYGKLKCSVCDYSCAHEKYAKENGFFDNNQNKEEEEAVKETDD